MRSVTIKPAEWTDAERALIQRFRESRDSLPVTCKQDEIEYEHVAALIVRGTDAGPQQELADRITALLASPAAYLESRRLKHLREVANWNPIWYEGPRRSGER